MSEKFCCDPFHHASHAHSSKTYSSNYSLRKLSAGQYEKFKSIGINSLKSQYICDRCRMQLIKETSTKPKNGKKAHKQYSKKIPVNASKAINNPTDIDIEIIYDNEVVRHDTKILNSSSNNCDTPPAINNTLPKCTPPAINNTLPKCTPPAINNTLPKCNGAAFQSLNNILQDFGKPLIDKKKLSLRSYTKVKCKEVTELIEKEIFQIPSNTEDGGIQGKYENLLSNLKKAYKETRDEHLKLAILTLFPDWTYPEIQNHFDTSERFITVAKKIQAEKGYLCSLGDDIDIITEHNININPVTEHVTEMSNKPAANNNITQNPNYFLTKEVTIEPLYT